MKAMSRVAFVGVLLAMMATSTRMQRPVLAQSPPRAAPMRVHHLHLNSVDPKAAAYYPKAFAESASATTFNGAAGLAVLIYAGSLVAGLRFSIVGIIFTFLFISSARAAFAFQRLKKRRQQSVAEEANHANVAN